MPTILIIEDEAKMRRLLELNLGDDGFKTLSAGDAETGLKLLASEPVHLVLTDLKLPGMSGLEFLQTAKQQNAALPIVVMTAFGSVETAVEAMKAGASDYVLKPFSLAEMRMVVHKELDNSRLREENRSLREALGQKYSHPNIVAISPKMQEVLATVERVAPTNSTVLLGGESGVGKDLIARAIHEKSRRASGPFVKINSTAIPENLLESELFGYEKGAFTGAATSKPGKFELADKGTLFLDEIGDVPPAIQVKLLRVLQEREFERLGGTRTIKVDVRLFAATNRDLRAALEDGTFREDLYYRLNVVPSTSRRCATQRRYSWTREPVPARFAKDSGRSKKKSPAFRPLLCSFLSGIIGRAMCVNCRTSSNAPARWLRAASWKPATFNSTRRAIARGAASDRFLPDGMTLDQWEDEMIREALKRAGGNKSQAARLLGLSRNALRYRLSKIGIDDNEGE
jgi:DNA-binding NtrC family response regulator